MIYLTAINAYVLQVDYDALKNKALRGIIIVHVDKTSLTSFKPHRCDHAGGVAQRHQTHWPGASGWSSNP